MGGKHRFYFFPSRIVLLTITSSIKLNLKNELILFSFHRINFWNVNKLPEQAVNIVALTRGK